MPAPGAPFLLSVVFNFNMMVFTFPNYISLCHVWLLFLRRLLFSDERLQALVDPRAMNWEQQREGKLNQDILCEERIYLYKRKNKRLWSSTFSYLSSIFSPFHADFKRYLEITQSTGCHLARCTGLILSTILNLSLYIYSSIPMALKLTEEVKIFHSAIKTNEKN